MMRKKIKTLLMLCMTLLILPTALTACKNVTGETNQWNIALSCGFDGYVKVGRAARATASITNSGEAFEGKLELLVPLSDNDSAMYQKDLSLGADQQRILEFDFNVTNAVNGITVRVLDRKGGVQASENLSLAPEYTSAQPSIGILSLEKDSSSLPYFDNSKNRIIRIPHSRFPDSVQGLDILDMMVVYNFDMKKLSPSQLNAIEEWIGAGGSLVIGADTYLADNLSVLGNGFIQAAAVGLDDSGITVITVAAGRIISETEKSIAYHQVLDKGLGNIQLIGYGLNTEIRERMPGGGRLSTVIVQNRSSYNKARLYMESQGNAGINNGMMNAAKVNDSEKLPQTGRYVVILLIYIVISGPVIYLILKKKDKSSWLWLCVPVISIVFSAGIYVSGLETRINEPFAGYANYIAVNDPNSKMADTETWFSVTNPDNVQYDLSVNGNYRIDPVETSNYYRISSVNAEAPARDNYSSGVRISGSEKTLEIRNRAAFTPVYFKTAGKTEIEGDYGYDLTTKDFKLRGTFRNQLGFDLTDTLIYSNGVLTKTGDIKNGSDININKKGIHLPAEIRINEQTMSELAGVHVPGRQDVSENLKKYYAWEGFFDQKFSAMKGKSFLVGFVEETIAPKVFSETDIISTGINMIVLPLDVSNIAAGNYAITDIYEYGDESGDGYGLNLPGRYLSDSMTVLYDFGRQKVKDLAYFADWNPECSGQDTEGFQGTVYAFDISEGYMVPLFQSGSPRYVSDISSYLTEGNQLILYFELDESARKTRQIRMPVITALKEAE